MEELYRIQIIFTKYKDRDPVILYFVDGYYCTDGMFYIHQKSGIVHYYSIDGIEEIRIDPMDENEEEV